MSTNHGCYHLIKAVYAIWNFKLVALLLFFNMSEAFNNINQACLTHNLFKQQVDTNIVQQIQSFLHKCSIIIKIQKHNIVLVYISNSISQDSPIFQVFYLFYNTYLLENLTSKKKKTIIGYINNISILVIEKNMEEISVLFTKAYTNICKLGCGLTTQSLTQIYTNQYIL